MTRRQSLGPLDPIYRVRTQYGSIVVGNTSGTPPLTVTINQASSQSDPTADAEIEFDVVFSEAVISFADADVTLSGTAGATTAIVSGVGPTYTVTVSGMTVNGTVIASIAANVTNAVAPPGIGNAASTSTDNTVTWFLAPLFGGEGPFSAGDGFDYLLFPASDTLGVNIPTTVEAMVVAGGGSGGPGNGLVPGGQTRGGGGGGGEVHYEASLAITAGQTVTVGAGGTSPTGAVTGSNGGNSSIGALVVCAGGGAGAGTPNGAGANGGSGGGGAGSDPGGSGAGGTTTKTPPGVGFNGAAGNSTPTNSARYGGGGGGAGAAGSTTVGGIGVQYADWSIIGYPDGYLAGGGSGASQPSQTAGGLGGGGKGGGPSTGTAGVAYSGGGGGGQGPDAVAAGPSGGSGIVALRYPSVVSGPPKFTATSRGYGSTPSLPSGAASGDLVVGITQVTQSGAAGAITFSSGWTGPTTLASGFTSSRAFARILDGSGSDTLTLTATGVLFYQTGMYLIKAADHSITNVSQISYDSSAAGTSNATAPTLVPTGGPNFLGIVGCFLNSNAGVAEVTAPPTTFAKSHNLISTEVIPLIRGMMAARRSLGTTITPGTFTNAAPTGNAHTWTIGVPQTP